MRWIVLLALAAAMAFAPARAYTPESGLWWNPQEPGTGMQLELQDNLLAVTLYAYESNGDPIWYTAAGFLDDTATFFQANLDAYSGGTCVGCPFDPNTYLGPAGTLTIDFDPNDPTRATMTWGLFGGPQRTTPIERQLFYLKRGEDGSAPLQVTKMLGEWTATFDFTDHPDFNGVQYYGEMLVFAFVEFDDVLGWVFDGCRPESMLSGECTDAALASTDATGYFDTSISPARHVIVVTDTRDQFGEPVDCLLYDVHAGTNQFEGGISNDGGVTLYRCGIDNPLTMQAYPVRGFRSASRTFVQEGTGPSKSAGSEQAASAVAAPTDPLHRRPYSPALADGAKREAAQARLPLVRALEQRLGVD